MIRISGAGSESWIVPPASCASALASHAPAALGSIWPSFGRAVDEHLAKARVQHDPRSLAPDRNLKSVAGGLGADVQAPTANERVADDQARG